MTFNHEFSYLGSYGCVQNRRDKYEKRKNEIETFADQCKFRKSCCLTQGHPTN